MPVSLILSTGLWLNVLTAVVALPQQEARDLAHELLTTGAALFDKHDAAAMASSFMENGEIQMLLKQQDGSGFKRDARTGRTAIQEGYAEVFKNVTPEMRSRNVVESARYIGNDLLEISGTFTPNVDKPDDSVPFVQVRVRNGGAWKIQSVHIYVLK